MILLEVTAWSYTWLITIQLHGNLNTPGPSILHLSRYFTDNHKWEPHVGAKWNLRGPPLSGGTNSWGSSFWNKVPDQLADREKTLQPQEHWNWKQRNPQIKTQISTQANTFQSLLDSHPPERITSMDNRCLNFPLKEQNHSQLNYNISFSVFLSFFFF